jgi:hypothetical protein
MTVLYREVDTKTKSGLTWNPRPSSASDRPRSQVGIPSCKRHIDQPSAFRNKLIICSACNAGRHTHTSKEMTSVATTWLYECTACLLSTDFAMQSIRRRSIHRCPRNPNFRFTRRSLRMRHLQVQGCPLAGSLERMLPAKCKALKLKTELRLLQSGSSTSVHSQQGSPAL